MAGIQSPEVNLTMTCLASPLQLEGTVYGYPAYFRARGNRWRFTIAELGTNPADSKNERVIFSASAKVPGSAHSADSFTEEMGLTIIYQCLDLWGSSENVR